MSLLFTENNPEKCEKCDSTRFIVNPIVQITKDKREKHVVEYLRECVHCGDKKELPKHYFEESKR